MQPNLQPEENIIEPPEENIIEPQPSYDLGSPQTPSTHSHTQPPPVKKVPGMVKRILSHNAPGKTEGVIVPGEGRRTRSGLINL